MAVPEGDAKDTGDLNSRFPVGPVLDERVRRIIRHARKYPYMTPEDIVRNADMYASPCPMKVCGHPLEGHRPKGQKLACPACPCIVNETTALGILIAEYEEKHGTARPRKARETRD